MAESKMTRRSLARRAAAVGVGLGMAAASAARVPGANERVRIGVIGVGNRGDQLLDAFRVHPDCRIAAISDVYEPYLNRAAEKVGGHPEKVPDWRKLVERKDLDAIVIATPDHWHALQFVAACRAEKDVYVEKPLALSIGEGRVMVDVARETKRITQMGTMRRSSKFCQEAVAAIRAGAIGQVTAAKCYHLANEAPMGIGNPPDCEPPAGLDWEMWLGPAKHVAYNPNRCFYKFRWFWDYSGGQLTNFGTHYLDLIQWALDQQAPKGVVAVGGKYAVHDNREIPDTLAVVWHYDATLVTMEQYNANHAAGNRPGVDLEFRGTKGTLYIGYNGFEIVPEALRLEPLPARSPLRRAADAAASAHTRTAVQPVSVKGRVEDADHARNFLDCVKSRRPCNCPVEVGHRSTSATLLGNIALHRGRYLEWDAEAERVTNDAEANRLLMASYRAPWKLSGKNGRGGQTALGIHNQAL